MVAATVQAPSDSPAPRRQLPLWARIVVWIVRLGLIYLIIRLVRNPWPLLRSRIFVALLLWIGFFVYWGIAARNSAATKSSESKASSWLHQILLTVALLVLLIPVPGLTGWFLPQSQSLIVAGAILQAAFILLAVWARRHLGRNWSSAVRIGEGHALVKTGPYRRLRHPIYTAMLGMFLATAIASGQYHALLGLAMLVIAYLRKAHREDQILGQTFGADYDAYRRGTWALVPFLY